MLAEKEKVYQCNRQSVVCLHLKHVRDVFNITCFIVVKHCVPLGLVFAEHFACKLTSIER